MTQHITKIYGCPGTGKTTTLLKIFNQELEKGVAPNRIAFLTFTRAARIEALTRTGKLDTEFPYLKTIHSLCYHCLGINKDQIVRPETLRRFGELMGCKLTGIELDPWVEEFERSAGATTRDDYLLAANHRGRHRKIMLKEALDGVSLEVDYKYAVWFTKAYAAYKSAEGLLDYTDLLSRYVEYGKPLDVDVIFVDEAQDLSALQWDAVRVLGANAKRMYVAGDDDQAVYVWAGADPHVFQNLEANYTEVLGQSFRLSKAVHRAAAEILSRIKTRVPKLYLPTEEEGEVKEAGYLTSIDFSEKTFILFRNHYRGSAIAENLRSSLIPFIGRVSPFRSVDTRAALFAYHSLVTKGESDSASIKRLLKVTDDDYLKPGVRNLVREKNRLTSDQVFIRKPQLSKWWKVMEKILEIEHIAPFVKKNGLLKCAMPKLEIMSVHQSKGREAHTVVIDPEMSRATWNGMLRDPDNEHRVWYVASTRASSRVLYLMPDGNLSYKF